MDVLAPNSAPKWLKQTFDEADKNGDGTLSIGEVLQLLHKLNVNLPRQRVKQMFRVSAERGAGVPLGNAFWGYCRVQMGSREWPARPVLWEDTTGPWMPHRVAIQGLQGANSWQLCLGLLC